MRSIFGGGDLAAPSARAQQGDLKLVQAVFQRQLVVGKAMQRRWSASLAPGRAAAIDEGNQESPTQHEQSAQPGYMQAQFNKYAAQHVDPNHKGYARDG